MPKLKEHSRSIESLFRDRRAGVEGVDRLFGEQLARYMLTALRDSELKSATFAG
jgi:hypothetical protein